MRLPQIPAADQANTFRRDTIWNERGDNQKGLDVVAEGTKMYVFLSKIAVPNRSSFVFFYCGCKKNAEYVVKMCKSYAGSQSIVDANAFRKTCSGVCNAGILVNIFFWYRKQQMTPHRFVTDETIGSGFIAKIYNVMIIGQRFQTWKYTVSV